MIVPPLPVPDYPNHLFIITVRVVIVIKIRKIISCHVYTYTSNGAIDKVTRFMDSQRENYIGTIKLTPMAAHFVSIRADWSRCLELF